MLHNLFVRIMGGASDAVIHELHGEGSHVIQKDAVAFLVAEQQGMRFPFGLGVKGIAITLDLATRLRHGRGFAALSPAARRAALDGWATNPIPPIRTFVQWIRALTALAYFDTNEGLACHGYAIEQVRAMTALYNSTSYERT